MKHMFKYLNYTSIPVAPGFPLAPYLCLTWQQMAISFATSFPRLDGTQPRRPKFACQRACGAPFFVLSFFSGGRRMQQIEPCYPENSSRRRKALLHIFVIFTTIGWRYPKWGGVTYSHRSMDVSSIFMFWRLIF